MATAPPASLAPLLVHAVTSTAPKAETREGSTIGSVGAYLVDKGTGRAAFAVLSLGGFLGMNKSYYPVPFELLGYDGVRDVYVVRVDPQALKGGPSWANHAPVFDAAYAEAVARYYASAAS